MGQFRHSVDLGKGHDHRKGSGVNDPLGPDRWPRRRSPTSRARAVAGTTWSSWCPLIAGLASSPAFWRAPRGHGRRHVGHTSGTTVVLDRRGAGWPQRASRLRGREPPLEQQPLASNPALGSLVATHRRPADLRPRLGHRTEQETLVATWGACSIHPARPGPRPVPPRCRPGDSGSGLGSTPEFGLAAWATGRTSCSRTASSRRVRPCGDRAHATEAGWLPCCDGPVRTTIRQPCRSGRHFQ